MAGTSRRGANEKGGHGKLRFLLCLPFWLENPV
jgi:hypothetical protein